MEGCEKGWGEVGRVGGGAGGRWEGEDGCPAVEAMEGGGAIGRGRDCNQRWVYLRTTLSAARQGTRRCVGTHDEDAIPVKLELRSLVERAGDEAT
jgi:hypothetical protein